ncbi:MAG: hypothetical protein ACRDJW_19525, partial [Thermomicrobiales bacterium]
MIWQAARSGRWRAPKASAAMVRCQRPLLMRAGEQAEGETGVVSEKGERMHPGGRQRPVAHEVELPPVVGRGVFEALPGMGPLGRRREVPMPLQDGGDRARCRP